MLKSDEESERIAEQFLAGEMDCDKFLQVYVKSRTVSKNIKRGQYSRAQDSVFFPFNIHNVLEIIIILTFLNDCNFTKNMHRLALF